MQDFLAHPFGADTNSNYISGTEKPCCNRKCKATPDVSGNGSPASAAVLHDLISDAELASHVAECHLLMQLAKARFRGTKSPQDSADAAMWARLKDNAIRARQDAHKERQARDESTFQGAWTDEVLNRSATHFNVPAGAVRRRMGALK